MGLIFYPLSIYGDTLKCFALLGDDMQLPPHGSSDLELSNPFTFLPRLKRDSHCVETRLEYQYRMHFTIAKFRDTNVYKGKLKTPPSRMLDLLDVNPIAWIDVKSRQTRRGTSIQNASEANAIKSIICARRLGPFEYAVITGYDAQRRLLSDTLADLGKYHNERVYTIDSYQGHEAPIGTCVY